MLSKEEILQKAYDIQEAFTEYAKQEAIGFGIWINFNGWKEYDEPDRWICPTDNNDVIPTKQLYQKYLNSKRQC